MIYFQFDYFVHAGQQSSVDWMHKQIKDKLPGTEDNVTLTEWRYQQSDISSIKPTGFQHQLTGKAAGGV